jgi:transcriptional regulator with XRE-family HTH domain
MTKVSTMKRTRIRAEIGSKLKHLRQQNRLSAKDVADELGVAESTYRDWEYGRAINGEPYVALARIFKVSLSELLSSEITKEKDYILQSLRKIEALVMDIKAAL